jgi:hypothetical protein
MPVAPLQYSPQYIDQLTNVIRLILNDMNAVQVLTLSGLVLDIRTLPTEADFANLRSGTVYRDSIDPTNTLKIKV